MPRKVVPLSATGVAALKAVEGKTQKFFDGGGLFLQVGPLRRNEEGKPLPASRHWRLKYRIGNEEKLISLGAYPDVSLAEARRKRDLAREKIAKGIDPALESKARRKNDATDLPDCFETVAREWHGKYSHTWSASHATTILRRLEKEVFPFLGTRHVNEIKAPELLGVLRRTETRGALDIAHRVRDYCNKIFGYAIATGIAERNPASDIQKALPPVVNRHYAAPTDPKDVAPMLKAFDTYTGSYVVKCALQLLPMLFCRPGELRAAEWTEIDLDAAEWNIPASRMKMKVAHLVPLPHQAVEILESLQTITGRDRYVFPSHRSTQRCMSENALTAAYRRLGFEKHEVTAHGFRATARTILDEVLHQRPDFIEHQLAHAVKDPNGRAYNRTAHLAERRKMMQLWADYLDGLKKGTKR